MKTNCIYKKQIKNIIKCDIKKGEKNTYYYIYKITFPNGNYYIGMHRTKKLDDGYCGSGVLLPREYSRYNINDITKEIISFHKDVDELCEAEKREIGTLYKDDDKCLNLVDGGSMGFNEKIVSSSAKSRKGRKRSKESIEKQRISCIGKKHSEETKRKQSEWHKRFWKTKESDIKREKLRQVAKNRVITDSFRKTVSERAKRLSNTDYGYLIKRLQFYKKEIIENNVYDYFVKCLELAKNNSLQKDDKDFFVSFFNSMKEKRLLDAREKKRSKVKYIMTEEHRRHLSQSKKGKKASEETKLKFSIMRSGRGNSRYCPDKIEMYDLNYNLVRVFSDCIEATEYVKNNLNPKACGGEIFVACRTGRTRYNHKWKQIKLDKIDEE